MEKELPLIDDDFEEDFNSNENHEVSDDDKEI